MSLKNDIINDGIRNMRRGVRGKQEYNELKKGHWRPAEDAILAKYVMKNGESNWNDLQRKGLLMRCGQSCRLRWVNHLRSNIKKGAFTLEEKSRIVRLHAEYGNRWSFIALHLPGRTDNEIKNYWYARFKRRVRNGLPVYPPGIHQHIKRREFFHLQPKKPPQSQKQLYISSSSSSSSFLENLDFNPSISSLSSSYVEHPSFNCIPTSTSFLHQTNMAASSLSSLVQANPDYNHFDFMSLMDPMSYPFLLNSSYHLDFMPYSNLDNYKNDGLTFTMPPPQNLSLSSSPYMPLFDKTRQITSLGMNPISQMDEAFSSKNFELYIPSIRSSVPSITPTYSSTNMNNVNCDTVSVPNGSYMTSMDASSSRFSLIDMGLKSQAKFFKDLNMMNNDSCSWLEIPPNRPPKELEEFLDDSYTKPPNPSTGIIFESIDNLQSEVLCSYVSLPNGNDMTFMDDFNSGFLPNDMEVKSKNNDFEGVNMMINDNWCNWSWLDFPPIGPPNHLNQDNNDAINPMEQSQDWSPG
ncbi:transcription factor MYB120 [Lactuca sativa]|nr:transcription factor MYB120 [Lactuca sativa]